MQRSPQHHPFHPIARHRRPRRRHWQIRAFAGWLAVLGGLATAPTVEAHPVMGRPANTAAMRQGPIELTATRADGRRLDAFAHEGRYFLAGDAGERYELHLRNRSGTRMEVVVSVDGRDVLTGEEADFTVHRGYVVPAWGSVTIAGFRRSFEEVAAFRFSSPGAAYSAQLGTPQHVGVIGVAAFKERSRKRRPTTTIAAPPRPRPPKRPSRDIHDMVDPLESKAWNGDAREATPPSGTRPARTSPRGGRGGQAHLRNEATSDAGWAREEDSGAAQADQPSRLGTAWGESRRDRVRETRFRRRHARRPDVLMRVDYDSMEGLYARGVIESPRPHAHRSRPDPFPGRTFASPPPGRW